VSRRPSAPPWLALAHELRGFGKLCATTPGINTTQELADSECIEVDCRCGARLALPWGL
jgi:hypothetical protein